jgi:hypothetical protein
MLSPSSRSTAKPAAAWWRSLYLFFLVDEVVKHFYKIKQWALKTVAAAASL